ncbi:MAG: hypothetical protein JWO02_2002 [Solirubrobacterales bacterium]|nr:hypothetical protein [Solirubrobacterales bacterium]
MRRATVVIAACIVASLSLAPAAGAQARPRWDTRLLALIPQPGFPAHAYVHPNGRIYEGTYVNPDSRQPSRVFEFAGEGTLLRSWTMAGQDVAGDHGVQVATSDARGRLVLLDHTPARVLLLDRSTGDQITYATFPAIGATAAVPNYAAWGPDGSLYVTDYANNVVWRVPPGGGGAELWLQDPQLATIEFGTTGIKLTADRRTLLIGQQTAPGAGNLLTGGLFAVDIQTDGTPGAVRRIWQSGPLDLPDGFAIARSGRIYVTALGPNQLVALDADGREQERFPKVPLLGENGSTAPFDAPSNASFLGTRLIVANQSNPAANPDHWALLDVEVGEDGLPEHIPVNAGMRPGEQAVTRRPARPRLAVTVTPRRALAGALLLFRFRATGAGRPVAGALIRFAGRRVRTNRTGRATILVRLRRTGTHRVQATKAGLTQANAGVAVRRR